MPNIVITAILVLCVFYNVQAEQYVFSQPVGPGGGTSFTLGGDGPITAIRLWEGYNSYITGIQFRYGNTWSALIGLESGMPKELELFKGETFIQVSGKYSNVIHSIVFITNKGRMLQAGQPLGNSFNMYAPTKDTELILISGQNRGGSFTFFGAHWGVPNYYV